MPRTYFVTACIVLLALIAPFRAVADDCVCRIQKASPGIEANGQQIVDGMDLACGATVVAQQEGILTIRDGMRLNFTAGARMTLPASLCRGNEALPTRVRGIVRFTAQNAPKTAAAHDVPAAFRSQEPNSAFCGIVEMVEGKVELFNKGEPPLPVEKNARLYAGERIRTGTDGHARIQLQDGSRLLLGPEQILVVSCPR